MNVTDLDWAGAQPNTQPIPGKIGVLTRKTQWDCMIAAQTPIMVLKMVPGPADSRMPEGVPAIDGVNLYASSVVRRYRRFTLALGGAGGPMR